MRKEILSFLSVCRTIVFQERVQEEIEFYRNCQNLSQKEFDKSDEYGELSASYKNFSQSFDTMIENYLNHAFSDLYIVMVEKLSSVKSSEEFIGISKEFSSDEVSDILEKTYDEVVNAYRESIDEVEAVLFFTNIVRNVIDKTEDTPTIDTVCPYCGNKPDIVEAADFFGEDSKYDGKRVCCCECGAYALVNDSGDIVGTMADKELHKKRNRVLSLMSQYSDVSGSLYYETRMAIGKLIGKSLPNKNPASCLNTEECNKIIHSVLGTLKKIKESSPTFPKCHAELISALKNGLRLRVVKELSAKNNKRLLVPSQVGENSFMVLCKGGGTETFMFPKGLKYSFENEKIKILHPSGNYNEYTMYPEDYRNIPL